MDYKKLNNYIDTFISPVDPILSQLHRETHLKTLSPQMSSGPTQGKLLELLSKMLRPKSILEIGTYTGYATICLAQGMGSESNLITIDPNEEVGYIARKYFDQSRFKDQIHQIFGKAEQVIPKLDRMFDLVFIDANKEAYIDYFEMILPKVNHGGFILADNILWYGKVWEETNDKKTKLLHQFNELVANDPRVENVIIPLRDGINLIRKI